MKKFCLFALTILFSLSLTGCFSEKESPFYDSEWVMQNLDDNANLYYHHLILSPGHKVMLRASYADSTNIIVWTGTYKINSKKIIFDFTECVRFENGEVVGKYKAGQLIKYYAGEFFYSIALLGESQEEEQYHLQLIRPTGPKYYFYGENKDIFGNHMEDFIKMK